MNLDGTAAPTDETTPLPTVVLPQRPPIVLAEENKIRQVITNLMGNAMRFTAQDDPIEIGIGVDDERGMAHIDVIDHGEGIPPQLRDKIFQRFWRADTSRARDTGGSGLGLAIVSGIVQAHNGSVEVFDTEGGGATFRVWLPLLPRDYTPPLPLPPRPDTRRAGAGPAPGRPSGRTTCRSLPAPTARRATRTYAGGESCDPNDAAERGAASIRPRSAEARRERLAEPLEEHGGAPRVCRRCVDDDPAVHGEPVPPVLIVPERLALAVVIAVVLERDAVLRPAHVDPSEEHSLCIVHVAVQLGSGNPASTTSSRRSVSIGDSLPTRTAARAFRASTHPCPRVGSIGRGPRP